MHIGTTRSRSNYPYQPLSSEDWRESLSDLLRPDLSGELNALVCKLLDHEHYIPTETELNSLIWECTLRGKVKPLGNILAQVLLETLHITKPADERAWQTLVKAMPKSCSATKLISNKQTLDRDRISLMFELMGRMHDLETLDIDSCTVALWALRGLPSCPPLLELRNLYVKNTDAPFELVFEIIEASSKLSGFHLDTNAQINDEQHLFIALALSKRHAFTLQNLTIKGLRDEKCFAPYIDLIKKATALTHVDISRNELSSSALQVLNEALQGNTGLTRLSLEGCCPEVADEYYGEQFAGLVAQKGLVYLGLGHNKFTSSMKPVLTAISTHSGLRYLDLREVDMSKELIAEMLPLILENNTTLVSLQLPILEDSDCACLVKAMKDNRSLRSLSAPNLERCCSTMSMDEVHRLYPNYLALMALVAVNERAWRAGLVEAE